MGPKVSMHRSGAHCSVKREEAGGNFRGAKGAGHPPRGEVRSSKRNCNGAFPHL
jgi:hypothetical protein